MPVIRRVAHFSIPVSDLERSIKFYTDVVGCELLRANKVDAFMDAGGTCLLLSLQKAPVNPPDGLDFVHHSFDIGPDQFESAIAHLTGHGVEVLYSEVREGGTVNGPRIYFRDPDGTRLEFINLTSYDRDNRASPSVTPLQGQRPEATKSQNA